MDKIKLDSLAVWVWAIDTLYMETHGGANTKVDPLFLKIFSSCRPKATVHSFQQHSLYNERINPSCLQKDKEKYKQCVAQIYFRGDEVDVQNQSCYWIELQKATRCTQLWYCRREVGDKVKVMRDEEEGGRTITVMKKRERQRSNQMLPFQSDSQIRWKATTRGEWTRDKVKITSF